MRCWPRVSAREPGRVLFPNCAQWLIAWLAAARIGALTVPLSTFARAPNSRAAAPHRHSGAADGPLDPGHDSWRGSPTRCTSRRWRLGDNAARCPPAPGARLARWTRRGRRRRPANAGRSGTDRIAEQEVETADELSW